jgi:hypothetical protein
MLTRNRASSFLVKHILSYVILIFNYINVIIAILQLDFTQIFCSASDGFNFDIYLSKIMFLQHK